MLAFKPSFSVDSLVSKTRTYGESRHNRNFCGLHTPIYRVINFAQDWILQHRIARDFMMNTSRGQAKWIVQHDDALSIKMTYGYSAVKIGARTIFAVDENTRTIYHIDATGRLRVTDYYQDYDMSDVIAQVSEAIEVLADCYVAPVVERVETPPIRWTLNRVMLDRPYHGPIKGRKVSVVARLLRCSKKQVRWCVEWMDKDNNENTKIEKGGWNTAYKVEIDGVVAWLPHSILGGLHNIPFTERNQNACRLDVPEWWVRKNIADKLELPF